MYKNAKYKSNRIILCTMLAFLCYILTTTTTTTTTTTGEQGTEREEASAISISYPITFF